MQCQNIWTKDLEDGMTTLVMTLDLAGPEQVLVQFFNAVANLLQREFTRSEVFGDLNLPSHFLLCLIP